jgi:hypothetical protein
VEVMIALTVTLLWGSASLQNDGLAYKMKIVVEFGLYSFVWCQFAFVFNFLFRHSKPIKFYHVEIRDSYSY